MENVKRSQLDQIERAIIGNNVCSELAENATQLVFGAGNSDADLLFIGEAPGKKEDAVGEPFVGASGNFLEKMLQSIHLERKDIYITNIVKYRPPNNRDPSPQEKAEFLPYLQAQIEVIQPKLILTLGRHSLNCFFPDLQISKVHGQLITYEPQSIEHNIVKNISGLTANNHKNRKQKFLPLYHPASALYNGKMRSTLFEDFAQIPIILGNI